jgi:TP901 family phage tail tape measure protein
MTEELGKAVLVLETDRTRLIAGLQQSKRDVATFRKDTEAASKAATAAFRNAIAPVPTQTADSFRKLFVDVRTGATTSATSVDKLRASFVGAAEAAGRQAVAQKKAADEATAAMARQEAAIRRQAAAAQTIGTAFGTVGRTMTAMFTVPIVGAGGLAIKAAMDFESSFAGVRKTVNATEAEFKEMELAFRSLAKTIPINVNELNRLGEAAGALGIPKAEIVDFARVMALLGTTTNLTSDQAAESIAKIQNIFGAAGQDTERFASTLVALGNNGASTETQIVEMATRIAGAGHAIGMTQGEVLAFASSLSSVGIEAEMGGSAISRVFIDIASSVSHGGEALQGFAQVAGMSVDQFSKMFKTDAAGAVNAFLTGLGNVKKSGGDLLGTLEALGFSEIRVRDTLLRTAGASGLLTRDLKLQGEEWEKNNALAIESEKRFDTAGSKLVTLKNRVYDAHIELGQKLLPILIKLLPSFDHAITKIGELIDAFGKLPVGVQEFAVATLGVLAIGGPLMIALGAVVTAWGQIRLAILAAKAAQLGFGVGGIAGGAAAGGAAAGGVAVGTGLASRFMLPVGLGGNVDLSAADRQVIARGMGSAGRPVGGVTMPTAPGRPDLSGMFGATAKAVTLDAEALAAALPGLRKQTDEQKAAAKKAADEQARWNEKVAAASGTMRGFSHDLDMVHFGLARVQVLESRMFGPQARAPLGILPTVASRRIGNGMAGAAPSLGGSPPINVAGNFESLGSALSTSLQAAPQILVQAFTGGGGLSGAAQAIGSQFGSNLMSNVFGSPGAKSGLLKNMTGMFGDVMGQAMPVIGALVGPLIDVVVGAFDHKKKDFKRMGRELGVTLSDAMIDQLKADEDRLGGEVQAMLVNLDKIIDEAGGVEAFGFDRATAEARDLFSMIEQGTLTVREAGSTFDRVFGQLADALGPQGTATAGMRELIELDRRFGTESANVTKYVTDNARAGVDGLTGYLQTGAAAYTALGDAQTKLSDLQRQYADATGDDRVKIAADIVAVNRELKTQQDIIAATAVTTDAAAQAMSAGLLGAFGELQARGVSITDAMKAVEPGAQALATQLQKAGLDGGAAFADLLSLIGLTKDSIAGPALNAVSQLNQGFLGLHNAGLMNQEMFAGLAGQVNQTRAALIAQGKDGGQVLRLMQPTLQTMWELQRDFGYEVDESTQAMLDEAEAADLVGNKHRSAQERMALAAERTNEVLEAMAAFMGVTLPAAAESGARRAQAALDGIKPPNLTATVELDDSGLPRDASGRVILDGRYPGGPNDPDRGGVDANGFVYAAARGALVGQRGLQYLAAGGLAAAMFAGGFVPRGTDVVPAMLTPGEGVINTLGMGRLGVDGLRALNHGEPMSTAGTPTGFDTSRLEMLLSGVQDELRELQDAVRSDRVTSIHADGREFIRATHRVYDNGGVPLSELQELAVRKR